MIHRTIVKHITNSKIKEQQQCIEIFISAGVTIINSEKLEFTENHNFTTHSGKNRMMLFHPLLKGSLSFDIEKNLIKWNLNIDNLVVKTILTIVTITLFWQFLIQNIWTNSILVGGAIGVAVLGINWLVLSDRIDRLTIKLTR